MQVSYTWKIFYSLVGPLPAKDLVEKLMAEDGHSAITKDDKVTVQTAQSSTPLPWTAEEQKVPI